MEILSSQSIWKQYYKNLPYNISVAYTRTISDIVERGIYFDGLTVGDAVTRVFAAVFTRESNKADNFKSRVSEYDDADKDDIVRAIGHYDRCVLFFDDVESSAITPDTFLEQGYCVVKVDYVGLNGAAHCTRYPKDLASCNYSSETNIIKDVFRSSHYVWAYNGFRATNIALMAFNDVTVYGKGLGGSIAYKMLISNNLKNAVIIGNVVPEISADDDTMLLYRAALDNHAYAKQTATPTLIIAASNDPDNSIDNVSELARETNSLKNLIILPRATIKEELSSSISFIYDFLNNSQSRQEPTINVQGAENSIYFNVNCDAAAKKLSIYVATSITKPKFRNWTSIKVTKSGQSDWFAKCNVFSLDHPIVYFVSIEYDDDKVTCLPVTYVNTKQLDITPKQKIHRRLLYSTDDGLDNWYSPIFPPEIKEAALKIEGLTSKSNELTTYKPGDFLYRAERDNIMQLTIFGVPQNLTIKMTDSNDVEYSTSIILKGDDWQKFTLSHENLKSSVKPLESFSDIVKLKISGTDAFFLNSILWV